MLKVALIEQFGCDPMASDGEQLQGRIFRSPARSGLRIAHRHPELEFNFVTKGSGAYIVDGKRRELRAGAIEQPRDHSYHPAVTRALLLLESSEVPDTLEELGFSCGLAPAHLGRLLKRDTGTGFVELRNRARLRRFVKIYRHSGIVASAADEAGFGSIAQFYRAFRAATGRTPAEWAANGAEGDVFLDQLTSASPEAERNEVRWYSLAEVALPPARGAIDVSFVGRLSEGAPETADPLSVLPAPEQSAANRSAFASDYTLRDPQLGVQFNQLVAKHDVFETYHWLCALYHVDPGDLATAVGSYLLVAHIAVHCSADISQSCAQALFAKVRAALKASGPLVMADNTERRRVADAFIHQGVILYHAILAARGSDNGWLLRRVGEAADRAASLIFHCSLRSLTISEHGSVEHG